MAELTLSTEREDAERSEHDEAKRELESYLNKRMRIGISDGRVIDGMFLCTDRDSNIVLGNCEEFLSQEEVAESERAPSERTSKYLKQPRTLSLAIVPGEHICSIALAIEQKTPPPTAQNAGDNNDPSHHTDTV